MKIEKPGGKQNYNEYRLTLSYGELVALENSLTNSHSGPIADELLAGFKYFLDDDSRLPKPGQDPEDIKRAEKEKEEAGEDEEAELPLPSPDEDILDKGPEGAEEEIPAELPSPEEANAGGDIDKMLPPPEE